MSRCSVNTRSFSWAYLGSVMISRSRWNFDSMCWSSWTRRASSEEPIHLATFRPQVIERNGDDSPQQPVLGSFVLFLIVLDDLFVGGLRFQHVAFLGDLLLEPHELLHGELAFLDIGDQAIELGDPPLEGPHQGVGGAGQATLEHAHRQACGGTIEQLCPVVDRLEVLGRFVVEVLFAVLRPGSGRK